MLARNWSSWRYQLSLLGPFQPTPPRTPTFFNSFLPKKCFLKREYSGRGTLLCGPKMSGQNLLSCNFPFVPKGPPQIYENMFLLSLAFWNPALFDENK